MLRECHCVLCLAGDEEEGFHVVGVDEPPYAYTVGLWHSFGSPELVIFGLEPAEAVRRLEDAAAQVAEGRMVRPDQQEDDVLGDLPVIVRPSLASWHLQLFPELLEFHRGQTVPVVQLYWLAADTAADTGAQPRLWDRLEGQPEWSTLVAAPASWPFPDPPETVALTTRGVAFEGAPVMVVVHDDEGEWQFLDGDPDLTDVAFVHLGHVVEHHPEVVAVADLPVEWEARRGPGGRWRRELSDLDEA